MKFCVNCGRQLSDDVPVCPACGAVQPVIPIGAQRGPNNAAGMPDGGDTNQAAAQSGTDTQPAYYWQKPVPVPPPAPYGYPVPPYTAYPNATGYLVWSIILLLFCRIFGIPAVIFAAMAMSHSAPVSKAENNIRLARIFCILGTVAGALYILFIAALQVVPFIFHTT